MKRQKIMSDMAGMAGGAVEVISGFGRSAKEEIRSRIDERIHRLNLVPREDFERLQMLLDETIKRQDRLEKELAALKPKTTRKAKKG